MTKKILCSEKLIREHHLWRVLEIIPGALTWSAFILVIAGSLYFPVLTANLIITYTLVWVFRTFIFSYNLVKSFHYSKKAALVNWDQLNNLLEHPGQSLKIPPELEDTSNRRVLGLGNISLQTALSERMETLTANGEYLRPSEVVHCITIPTYKECYEVLRTSVESYVKSNFDLKKVIIMIAFEESDWANALDSSQRLKKEFGHHFRDWLHTCHPKNLPGEIRGRAANATWSAKALKRYLERENIAYNRLLLSSFDADTVISANYLGELTFRYCITPNRTEVGFQPVPFYHNNIWDVPLFNRLVALSCSFWQLSVSLRKDENKSFSSRAMNFQSVMDFGYWDSRVVQDDSRQYWTAFFVYQGRHYLENIYSPVYMDAVLGDSYLTTIKNQYLQLRRWAWGVSDFPFIVLNIFNSDHIPLKRKIYEPLHFLESVFFWATGPVILLFAGITPSLVNQNFSDSILSHNLPQFMSGMLNIAALGIAVCFFVTLQILPLNSQKKLSKKISLIVQWLFVPVVSILLSALPAIDAQSRLLLNKRLDFRVTEKKRTETRLFSRTVSTARQ